MTSRRAIQIWDQKLSRALQFQPGHLGGRVPSAQPINRRGGTLRREAVGAAGEAVPTGCSNFDLDAAHMNAYSNETLTFSSEGDFSVYVTLEADPGGTPTIHLFAFGWGVTSKLGYAYGGLTWGARLPPRTPPLTVYAEYPSGTASYLRLAAVSACPIPAPPGSPATPPE